MRPLILLLLSSCTISIPETYQLCANTVCTENTQNVGIKITGDTCLGFMDNECVLWSKHANNN